MDNSRNQALSEGGRLAAKFRKFSEPLDYPAVPRITCPHSMVTNDLPASHVPFMMQSVKHWVAFRGWVLPLIIIVTMNSVLRRFHKIVKSNC